jgi:hypothetical protein
MSLPGWALAVRMSDVKESEAFSPPDLPASVHRRPARVKSGRNSRGNKCFWKRGLRGQTFALFRTNGKNQRERARSRNDNVMPPTVLILFSGTVLDYDLPFWA